MSTSNTNATHASRLIDASPIYYGWVILGVGAIAAVMTSPGQTYAVSVFIAHFIADLGISRSLVSTLYTFGTLTASFALPFVGRRHLGGISGVAITIMVAAWALGPMPMGIARDLLGSYEAVLIGCAILPFVLGFANLMFSQLAQRAPSVAAEPVSTI